MYYVYVLLSKKDIKYYIGSTGDLKRRITEHLKGKVLSTKNRLPFELLCYEAYHSKHTAQGRERYLKTSDGHKDIGKRFK